MNWLNIKTSMRTRQEYLFADQGQRATWLSLILYSAEHETGGRISDCRDWTDLQWIQMCGVTKVAVEEDCLLFEWDRSDLLVKFYPLEQEAKCQAQRAGGRKGGIERARRRKQRSPDEPESKQQPVAKLVATPQAKPERKEKEGKVKERNVNLTEGKYPPVSIPELSSYEDIEAITDPIDAAIAVTGETEVSGWGYWLKIKNQLLSDGMDLGMFNRVFRECVCKIFGEMGQSEIRNPGGALNVELKAAFKLS